jgi:hypothetical protein
MVVTALMSASDAVDGSHHWHGNVPDTDRL